MIAEKPEWFTAHEKSDVHEFWDIKSTLKSQDTLLIELKKFQEELMRMQKEYHDMTIPVFEYMNEITVGRKIRWDYLKMTWIWTGVILGVASVWWMIWAIFKFLVFNAK